MNKHLKAIESGVVDRSNVIGLRKAINAVERRDRGYSTSRTCPKITRTELVNILDALEQREPRVTGPLVESGLDRLRNPRYKKRLAGVRHIIDSLTHFTLVWFEDGTPVYRACSPEGSFLFKNVAWQAGGDGPELVHP